MLESLLTPSNLSLLKEVSTSVCLLITFSLIGRFFLSALGQAWIRTYAHTATLVVLPIIAFIITKVISGNISLSLGLVGALSIVRFRNPVKSPFELAVYFGSITMGIAASVDNKWLIIFVFAIGFALTLLAFMDLIGKFFFNTSLFTTSFSEGNALTTLEVLSKIEISNLVNSQHLLSYTQNQEGFTYILGAPDKIHLAELRDEISTNKNISHIRFHA